MAVYWHSRLRALETCPLQYELRSIRKIRKDKEGIEATTVFEPCESALCHWFPYWDYGPAKKHEARIEAFPAGENSTDDGAALSKIKAEG